MEVSSARCKRQRSRKLVRNDSTFWKRYVDGPAKLFCLPSIGDLLWRCGPDPDRKEMVSRRKILSRSRDELRTEFSNDEEEDVWFHKDKLFKDHIQEVLNKWGQIDDEIWAKIICMERNRRVAKAYARAPVLTINGSDDGFDGYRIGLCGFENPLRDAKVEELRRQIGHGVKIKMDESGNVMVKRVSKSEVYAKQIENTENSVANDIIRTGGRLPLEKPVKLFDMKKFTANLTGELRKTYPDRRKLESQCISIISFVKDWPELLDCACWVIIINVVALDMLKSKLPPLSKRHSSSNVASVSDRSLLSEEDPYSVPSFLSSRRGRSGARRDAKPPKLPPRDLNHVSVPLPDYDGSKRENSSAKMTQRFGYKDDPYCCGMKARVPNFTKKASTHQKRLSASNEAFVLPSLRKSHSAGYLSLLRQNDRSPTDSGRESDLGTEDDYSRVYGRSKDLMMNYTPGQLYIGEWE